MKLLIFYLSLLSFFASCSSSTTDSVILPFELGVTGKIIQHDSLYLDELIPRPISVWLPPSYDTSQKSYPVIYFMDGQNVFNPKTSYIGVDWMIDEWADSLMKTNQLQEAIIVGVWNTEKRIHEYFPEKAEHYMTDEQRKNANKRIQEQPLLADTFLRFITQKVKPFVDSTYRTQSDFQSTTIAGSSMGGLISLYALSEYPNVFGTAICVSTHWSIGDGVTLKYFAQTLPQAGRHRIYFDYGTETLDSEYEPYQIKMDEIMRNKGFTEGIDWITIKFEGEDHSERAWSRRADVFLKFAIGKP